MVPHQPSLGQLSFLLSLVLVLLFPSPWCDGLSSPGARIQTNRQQAMEHYQHWAWKQPGVMHHPSLIWRNNDNTTDDWSLQLSAPVPTGTCLLEIPYDILWRASDCPPIPPAAAALLDSCGYGNQSQKDESSSKDDILDGFRLYCKLLEERSKADDSYWRIWLDALPSTDSLVFSDAALAALPVQARTMALQVRQRCEIFAQAAQAAGYATSSSKDAASLAALVYSRAWSAGDCDTMELVPIADMFNHHDDPANVRAEHDSEANVLRFRYTGSGDNVLLCTEEQEEKDTTAPPPPPRLGLSYGSPAHIHRFLVVFGFCDPSSIRRVSVQLLLTPLPGMSLDTIVVDDIEKGTVHTNVWYLIIDQLLATHRPTEHIAFRQAWEHAAAADDDDEESNNNNNNEQQHPSSSSTHVAAAAREHLEYERRRLRKPARQVLQNHLRGLLDELEDLSAAVVAVEEEFPMLRVEHEFLSRVYRRVLRRLLLATEEAVSE